jgi:hypothetical protein
MAKRIIAWWTVVSLTLAALAIVRLAEVFSKRELVRRAQVLRAETAAREGLLQDSLNHLSALRVDLASAQVQARVMPETTYIVMKKTTAKGQVMMGNKVVYEFRFRVRGSGPIKGRGDVPELPEGLLSVQERQDHPTWYKPDWMYEKAGQPVPKDSTERKVVDAFGRYALILGGGVAIHGAVDKGVPADEVDHVYAELNDKDLKAVFNSVGLGSLVIIQH